ncbi:MAG: ribonuclease III [Verrucomicrobiota bacterium]
MVASQIKRIILSLSGLKRKNREPQQEPSKEYSYLPNKQIKRLEKILGYTFKNKDLLVQSLTHPSFLLHTKDRLQNNQRLEFLGDSVIQLALTEALYEKFEDEREGKLTSARSSYARGDYMAKIARQLNLGEFLRLKPKDRDAGIGEQDGSLGDAFEALLGAVYLDSDYTTARDLTLKLYDNLDTDPEAEGIISNPKGKLQELIQPIHGNDAIRYDTTGEFGEPHNREFEITVFCNDKAIGVGIGRTKKEAAEKAAIQAITEWTPET